MRRHPHCAGCDERIRWGLRLVSVDDERRSREMGLYFHRRCALAYYAGSRGTRIVDPSPRPADEGNGRSE